MAGGVLIIADVNNRETTTEASCITSLYNAATDSLWRRLCVSFLSLVTSDVRRPNSFKKSMLSTHQTHAYFASEWNEDVLIEK